MANWLERARREIATEGNRTTAETAEGIPTAVMAVPETATAENSSRSFGSNGSASPGFPGRNTLTSTALDTADTDDDRRCCDRCANLTERGLCLAAWRGEIVASRSFQPVRDLPRRCEGYSPNGDDPDRRHGRERWPLLLQKGLIHGNA